MNSVRNDAVRRTALLSLALSGVLFLAACGSGGGDGQDRSAEGTTPPAEASTVTAPRAPTGTTPAGPATSTTGASTPPPATAPSMADPSEASDTAAPGQEDAGTDTSGAGNPSAPTDGSADTPAPGSGQTGSASSGPAMGSTSDPASSQDTAPKDTKDPTGGTDTGASSTASPGGAPQRSTGPRADASITTASDPARGLMTLPLPTTSSPGTQELALDLTGQGPLDQTFEAPSGYTMHAYAACDTPTPTAPVSFSDDDGAIANVTLVCDTGFGASNGADTPDTGLPVTLRIDVPEKTFVRVVVMLTPKNGG